MCVLVYKPAGVNKPDYNELYAMYRANPHGCGFCTPETIYKTMDFDDFVKKFRHVKKEDACLIHFRLATHGSIKTANCHPFVKDGIYFAHNGVLGIEPIDDMTDSETAFRYMIYPAIRDYGFYSDEVGSVVRKIIGSSKFALLTKSGVRLFGDFKKKDGRFYSNFRFQAHMLNDYRLIS